MTLSVSDCVALIARTPFARELLDWPTQRLVGIDVVGALLQIRGGRQVPTQVFLHVVEAERLVGR